MPTAPLSSEQAACPQPRKISDINDKSQDEPPLYISQTIPKKLSASDRRGVGYVRLWPIVLRSVLLRQISTWANFPTCVNNMFRPTFGVCVFLWVLVRACSLQVRWFSFVPLLPDPPSAGPPPETLHFFPLPLPFSLFFLSREVFSWNCCRDSRILAHPKCAFGLLDVILCEPIWRWTGEGGGGSKKGSKGGSQPSVGRGEVNWLAASPPSLPGTSNKTCPGVPPLGGCISVRGGSGGLHCDLFFFFLLCVFLFFC